MIPSLVMEKVSSEDQRDSLVAEGELGYQPQGMGLCIRLEVDSSIESTETSTAGLTPGFYPCATLAEKADKSTWPSEARSVI